MGTAFDLEADTPSANFSVYWIRYAFSQGRTFRNGVKFAGDLRPVDDRTASQPTEIALLGLLLLRSLREGAFFAAGQAGDAML